MRVTIRMKENAGVVGEDRKDWLGGEEHECSESYAKHLVHRGLATIVTPGVSPATAPVEFRDPVVQTQTPAFENRDPTVLTTDATPAVRPTSPRKPRG